MTNARLYALLQQAKQNEDEALELIFSQFEKKIEAELRQTPYEYRDDLRQELYVKILEAVEKYSIEEVPNFEQFIEEKKGKG
ncbi:helix-turn-helix domain-containing protein [Alkalihalobacillus macyae]|uniref:helix-turn-helix domain-containing protein n=1 Tax=Guptibacillus hwajinpoensis TaxID=208199 RepID=UPI00273B9FF6|nr:helix-turn-helix domain-containing protein [Alkalihalobacillus macyae]MDP4551489.1 helix-turn-helix domain-containing protein [Alkalihalobacillus macyae]